eukprot:TRINITY_DN812_c0_g2_i12.p1 TRINITY_DN812_c0_g2~~TRINITY_DN812_c0_g2_i12.p1  ORF type:complete len:437 (-),score=77.22 TRINITY_DN812_c0_g2_i12:322-1632(-)
MKGNVLKTHRDVDIDLSSDEEEEEEYHKGGYHTVRIGDVYKNRYTVQHKLGWGHFSTVWFCTDSVENRNVALKIVKSARHYREAAMDEIHILQTLANADPHNQSCVLRLLDNFDMSGPNGTHIVMAFEVLGCNLLSLIRMYKYRGLPIPLVRIIAKQMLLGVTFLHKCQVIHTDLKPENLLMVRTPQIVNFIKKKDEIRGDGSEHVRSSSLESSLKPLHGTKGREGLPWAREDLEEIYSTCYKVKIVDLGNACWTFKHFTNDVQTREYRAPEVILGASYGTPIDVWSIACIVFELLTGDQLFKPKNGKTYNKNEDHLALIIELMGKPKLESLCGKQAGEYFSKNGELRNIKDLKFWPLDEVFMQKYSMSAENASVISEFLTPMLAFSPKDRITAAKSVGHPWIKDLDVEDFSTAFGVPARVQNTIPDGNEERIERK